MFKITSGRKKESAIWKYFTYDCVSDKSKCSICSNVLSGKNPTNLKTHVSRYHKVEYKDVEKQDEGNKKPADKPVHNATVSGIS